MLEYRLQHSSLCELSVDELLARFGNGFPTPGGGSAAALAGYLGVSLLRMTLEISERKCSDAAPKRALQIARDHCEQAAAHFRFFVDEDSRTYDDLRQVKREARTVTTEHSATAELFSKVIQSAETSALRIPREIIILANQVLELLSSTRSQISEVVHSDLLVAGALLRAAVEGAQAVLDG